MTSKQKNDAPTESFEILLKKLEEAVQLLEQEELPLDTAIQQYKTAMQLVSTCRTRLEEAERTVNLLVKNANSEWQAEPLPNHGEKTNG